MGDGVFPDRLTQLRNRWEADPSSRVFLQLAEEYRHQGRVKEALDVLDQGLKEHPGYLSALVAKGRCHLELGEPEPARTVLERVVKQDATQMVANKLLVRAYLDTGDPERARDRLDLYSLLNDSDPEIEELRRRLRAMEQPPQAEKPGSFPRSDHPVANPLAELASLSSFRRATAPAAPAAPIGGDVFDLPPPAPSRIGGDVFELEAPRLPLAAAHQAEPFADLLAPPVTAPISLPVVAPAAVATAEPEPEEEEPGDVLFPGLASRESRRRYLDRLASEGIFLLDLTAQFPAAPPTPIPALIEEPVLPAPSLEAEPSKPAAEFPPPAPPVLEPWPSPEPSAWTSTATQEPPVFDLPERTAWAVAAAPQGSTAAVEPDATVTLGELYLRQGHLAEAERIFREVLRREPDSFSAREGLERLAARQRATHPVEVRDLPVAHEGETRARKALVLNNYLKRLRRGSQRDVS